MLLATVLSAVQYNSITIVFLLRNVDGLNNLRFNTLSRWLVLVKLVDKAYVAVRG
jgi:hypothetical protein